MEICDQEVSSRSKFSDKGLHKCHLPKGHAGRCEEFPYLKHLRKAAPKVAKKIERDAVMTTGASWKSDDAGPNRIRRWAMLKSDDELTTLGIYMAKLKPQVVAKLREKAATYDACMSVAARLTFLAYGMVGAPEPEPEVLDYLQTMFGSLEPGSTRCLVCAQPLSFALFHEARRGKAELETAHSNPRLHTADNVGFAHRACNIAQGDKTLDEFYSWIRGILERVAKK